MASRNIRTQSQSQPRPRSNSRRGASFEAWENVDDNARPSQFDNRRAKSSMRYKSATRDSSRQRMRGDPALMKTPSNPQPPRATSTGRIRSSNRNGQHEAEDNPAAMTQQIIELRGQREKGRESPMHLRPNLSMGSVRSKGSKTPSSKRPASPKGRSLQAVGSNMSQEEIQAEERLKRAENKISGLLQELDDLRFFDELEIASPTPKTPSRNNGIPTTIRAESPSRGGRLPPPPEKVLGGGLETYKPLSPRKIAKLDRNSLELECQTLVRKLQIIDHDRQSQAAMIEMYEISMQEYDVDKKKTKKLEGELKKVSLELKRQLQNIQKGKESLVKDYEGKLQNNLKKLHREQEKANSYRMDLDVYKADAEKWKRDAEKHHAEVVEGKKFAGEMKERHGALEMQLDEARNLNTSLVKKVEKKKAEISTLQEDLTLAGKAIQDSKQERNEMYESQIKSLESELSSEKKKNASLDTECMNMQSTVRAQDEALKASASKEADQAGLVTDLERQLANLETDCINMESAVRNRDEALRAASNKEADQAALIMELKKQVESLKEGLVLKFEEGKKATRIQETKRLQELIAGRAKETEEYERRIKSMQEQLRHQSDRHHAEIEETRKRNDENLELMREEVTEDIRLREGDRVAKLQSELNVLRRNSEQMKAEYTSRLKESQQMTREVTSEFQRQDEARQQELDHMQSRLEEFVNENSQKEEELSRLRDHLEEVKTKSNKELMGLKSKQESEMMKFNHLFEEERRLFESTKLELSDEIADLKTAKSKLEKDSKAESNDLLKQIDEAQQKLAQAQSVAKDSGAMKKRLEDLQSSLESVQIELQSERAHHEEIESDLRVQMAKMEGRLRASESSLKTKKARIHDLEEQIEASTTNYSKFGEEKESTIKLLSTKLEETTFLLEKEQSLAKEKEFVVVQLQEEVSSLQDKLSVMSRLEDTVKAMKRKAAAIEYEGTQKETELKEFSELYEETKSQLLRAEKKIDSLESEKIRKTTELSNLRNDYEDLSVLLEQNLHSSAKKDEAGLELRKKERELKETESRMRAEAKSNDALQTKIESLRAALDDTRDEKKRLSSEMSKLKREHEMVSEELKAFKKSKDVALGAIESDHIRDTVQRYTRTIANLESQLEEESQSRFELEDKLSSARAELEDKQNQTQEFIQSHTKSAVKLESELTRTTAEREELKIKLEQTTKDLEQKRKELKEIMAKYSNEFANLKNVKQEQEEIREMSESARSELERKEKQLDDMKQKIPELLAELDARTREREQFKASSVKYESELSDEKARMRQFEMKKIETDTKLDTLSRSKDELRSKVSELSSRLERKEREVREVTDRYKMYVTELESKLDQDTDAKHTLQSQIDRLKVDSTEVLELREKVFSMERSAENHRGELLEATKILEDKLETAMRSKEETEKTLKKLNNEKSEVINALEGVINEVQNREDEIEALTEILERRDEELQHAKIIATKALQSAKDIQKRYKDKEKDRQNDMMERMDELNDNIEALTSKNDSLQRKISMLERDLRDRNLECQRLRDQLNQIDARQLRDDASTYTKYSASPSRNNPIPEEEEMNFSPTNRAKGLRGETAFDKEEEYPDFQMQNSEDSDDLGANSTIGSSDDRWTQDGDNESKDDYESIKSRRSIERDALRKYVRERYAKR